MMQYFYRSYSIYPGGGHGNPLQYSCLENPIDRGAWQATDHRSQRVRHDWSDWAQHSTKFALQWLSHADSLRPHGLQHARIPCPSPSPRGSSNSCPLSQWCHPTITSSVIPFFSCLQSFPTLGSFLMNQVYASGGQSIGASVSFLPVNTQGWFCLGLTDLISFQSKGLSRVFSNIVV